MLPSIEIVLLTDTVRMHEKAHTKPYICSECRKGFSNKRDKERHEQIHDSQRSFRCLASGCDTSFTRRDALVRHLTSKHSDERATP